MPTITYNIKVENSITYPDLEHKKFRYSEVSEDRFFQTHTDSTADILHSKLGWSESSRIMLDNNNIVISENSIFLTEDETLSSSSKTIYMPEKDTDKYFFNSKVANTMLSACIFKNQNLKKSIYKDFYHSDSSSDKFSFIGFPVVPMESDIEWLDYPNIEIAINNPLEFARLSEYKYEISESDYDSCALDYAAYYSSKGYSLEDFIDRCELIEYNESNIPNMRLPTTSVAIRTKYFPVYKSVTVIIKDVSGTLVQLIIDEKDIDYINGSIFIKNDLIKDYGNIECFYLYYGIIPAVCMNSSQSINPIDVLNTKIDINFLGIDNDIQYPTERLTNNLLSVEINDYSEYAVTDLYVPNKYDNFFIEPSSGISINGNDVSAGDKFFITNNTVNNLTFSSTSNVLDMMDEIEIVSTDRYKIKNYLPGVVSVYGKFKTADRTSLSHICFSKKQNTKSITKVFGYGTGAYSTGGYSNGSILEEAGSKTSIVYTPGQPDNYTIDNDMISFVINPRVDGLSLAMPACTISSNIQVYEILGESIQDVFSSWTFSIPDIISLDPDKINPLAKYLVVFQPTINPLITTLYIHNGTFKSETLSNVSMYGNTLVGLYTMNSKRIFVKLGTKLANGSIMYFNSEIIVDVVINKDAIIRTTSKFKNINI